MYCCYTWPSCIAIHHTFVLDEELSWVQKKRRKRYLIDFGSRGGYNCDSTADRLSFDVELYSRIAVELKFSHHMFIYFFICTRYSVLQPQDWNKLLLHINVKYGTTSGKWWHDLFMTTQITPRRQFDIATASDDDWFALLMSYPTFNTVSNLY